MGGLFIIADPAVKQGVHMVNETAAGCGFDANIWYVKLAGGHVAGLGPRTLLVIYPPYGYS